MLSLWGDLLRDLQGSNQLRDLRGSDLLRICCCRRCDIRLLLLMSLTGQSAYSRVYGAIRLLTSLRGNPVASVEESRKFQPHLLSMGGRGAYTCGPRVLEGWTQPVWDNTLDPSIPIPCLAARAIARQATAAARSCAFYVGPLPARTLQH